MTIGIISKGRAEYLMGAIGHAGGVLLRELTPSLRDLAGDDAMLAAGRLPNGEPIANGRQLDRVAVLAALRADIERWRAGEMARCGETGQRIIADAEDTLQRLEAMVD